MDDNEVVCKIRTYQNLVPAMRQKNSDLNDQILNLQHEIRVNDVSISAMREFLAEHFMKEFTMAEWSANMQSNRRGP